MRALENRMARRRNNNPFTEPPPLSDNDSEEEILNRRRNLGFLKYADESQRSFTSMSRTREHSKQIAMAISKDDGFADFGSAFDDPTDSTAQSSWMDSGGDPFAADSSEPDFFSSPPVKLSAWESSPAVNRKAPGRTPQPKPQQSYASTTKQSRSPAPVPPTSYSTPQKQKNQKQQTASNSAAARRRMRKNMRQKGDDSSTASAPKQKLYSASPQQQSFFSDDSVSFTSASLWPAEETAAKITPRSSQQSFFEPKTTTSTGLSFDAFGLDGSEMKRTVNTAMLDLDEFAVNDWGDSTNSSVGSHHETFVVHKPPTAVVETAAAQLPSERSSLTESSEQRGSVNIFKEQAGFHKQPRRKVVRPGGTVRTESTGATTQSTWEPAWGNFEAAPPAGTQWVSPRSRMKSENSTWQPFQPKKIASSQIERIQSQLGDDIMSPEKLDALSEAGGTKPPKLAVESRSEGGAGVRKQSPKWNAFPGTSPRMAQQHPPREPPPPADSKGQRGGAAPFMERRQKVTSSFGSRQGKEQTTSSQPSSKPSVASPEPNRRQQKPEGGVISQAQRSMAYRGRQQQESVAKASAFRDRKDLGSKQTPSFPQQPFSQEQESMQKKEQQESSQQQSFRERQGFQQHQSTACSPPSQQKQLSYKERRELERDQQQQSEVQSSTSVPQHQRNAEEQNEVQSSTSSRQRNSEQHNQQKENHDSPKQEQLSHREQREQQQEQNEHLTYRERRKLELEQNESRSSAPQHQPELTYRERRQLELQQQQQQGETQSSFQQKQEQQQQLTYRERRQLELQQQNEVNNSPPQEQMSYAERRQLELRKQQQAHQQSSPPRHQQQLSYRERRELELQREREQQEQEQREREQQQRNEAQSARQQNQQHLTHKELQNQKKSPTPSPRSQQKPDIREQIKRRVAAAKQSSPSSVEQQPPAKPEFSAIRNRLRPVGQREETNGDKSLSSADGALSPSTNDFSNSSFSGRSPKEQQSSSIFFAPKDQQSSSNSLRVDIDTRDAPKSSPQALSPSGKNFGHSTSPKHSSPRRPTPRAASSDMRFSASPRGQPSPMGSVRSSLHSHFSQDEIAQLPTERPRVEEIGDPELAFESSSSEEEEKKEPEVQTSVNKAMATAAISQSLLMRQIQQRQQPKAKSLSVTTSTTDNEKIAEDRRRPVQQQPKSQAPPAVKALSVATSDATSENVSEDRNRTPKATMMMLNAFLAGRESIASSDGPVATSESNEAGTNDPLERCKSPIANHSLPPLKDDPKYEKYFKMMKIGMPIDVVKHAMTRDGVDPSVLDGDHNKPVGIPLKDDPTYSKYFRMLSIGLPIDAVKHSMERDGLDSAVMDQDHELPAASQKTQEADPKEEDSHRRARLHWKTLRKVTSNSLWARIDKDPGFNIEIDEEEFQELFQAEKSASAVTAAVQRGGPNKHKSSVCVIDVKRANNGGIILARLKMSHDDMADAVDRIDENAMTAEQIENIIEYLPSKDEKKALESYMLGGGQDAAEKFDALCECEKFMVSMMTVKHAKRKVSAILFKLQFETCVRDIQKEACLVEKACTELYESTSLRQLLGIVLTFGNRLNTAGNGKRKAGAFTLDSLLKLRQAKAFDKKTTFLHYIVLIVQRNNTNLLEFKDEVATIFEAEKIFWDQCVADLEKVEHQLENVRKIALYQSHQSHGYRLRKKSKKDDPEESLTDDDEELTLEDEVEHLRATPIGMFTLSAIKYISQLREKVESTKTIFAKLLEYFGEEESAMQPHELFNIIVRFCKDFEKAKQEVVEKKKLQDREERRQRNSAQKQSSAQKTPARRPPGMLLKASSHQPNMSSVLSELKTTAIPLRRTSSDGLTSPQLPSQDRKKPAARSDVGRSPSSSTARREAPIQSAASRYHTPQKGHGNSPEYVTQEALRRAVQRTSISSATSISTTAMRAKAKMRLNRANQEAEDPVSPRREVRGICDDVGADQPVSPRQTQPSVATASRNTLSPRSTIRMKKRVQHRNRNQTGF